MASRATSLRLTFFVVVCAALLCVSSATALEPTAHSAQAPSAAAPKPATTAEWARIVAAAKREGSVVIYTSQNPTSMADMAAKFKAKYGINVTINRNIDSVTAQQVTSEFGSGRRTADLWVTASKPHALGSLKNGWVVDARGPNLFAKAYDRKVYAKPGKAFIVGAAVLGMSWNTSFFPQGLKDFPDILNPRLKGRIGIPQPTAASFVDWYLWLEATYGRNILTRLAAQEPKIYASSLPMLQAVASGEIAASPFTPATALDLKGQGAPVDFKLAKGFNTWNAPFYGMVLRGSPHPNAAQLLADYLVTKEGQATGMRLSGVVMKGVPNAFFVKPRQQNLKALTPAKVAEFQARWARLFQ
jgi:iron(III) transport system substrate-binding protein